MAANRELAKRRGLSEETITQIEKLQKKSAYYVRFMSKTSPNTANFKKALEKWRKLQVELQILWKFPVDKYKWCEHRLPYCTCPKMDNDDMGGHYYITAYCPVHTK